MVSNQPDRSAQPAPPAPADSTAVHARADILESVTTPSRVGTFPAPELAPLPYAAFQRLHYHVTEVAMRQEISPFVTEFAQSLPPMRTTCRMSLCMVVGAHEEERAIGQALKSLSSQTLSPEAYEIILFLNHPETRGGAPVSPDRTAQVSREFTRNHPELPIHSFYAPIPERLASIGLVRRLVNDAVIHRYCSRGRGFPDHLLLQEDADLCAVHPRLMERAMTLSAKHPNTASFQGPIDFDWKACLGDPLLLFGVRLMQAIDSFDSAQGNRTIFSHGQNIAVRATYYARVQGHDISLQLGENLSLCRHLQSLQSASKAIKGEDWQAIHNGGPLMRAWVSPRRGAAAVFGQDAAFIEQWATEKTAFSLHNRDIRRFRPVADKSAFFSQLNADDFDRKVEGVISRTLRYLREQRGSYSPDLVERVLCGRFGLTLEHDQASSSVRVLDSAPLRSYLRWFGTHAEQHYARRVPS